MVVQCPHCAVRLTIPAPRAGDPPTECPECSGMFLPQPATAPLVPVPEAVGDEDDPFTTSGPRRDPEPAPKRRGADARTKAKPRAAAKPEKKFPVLLVGGALLATAAVVGLVVVLMSGDTPKPVAANPDPVPAPPKKVVAPKKDGQRPPQPQPKPTVPPEFAELFAASVTNRPAPTVLVPSLQKIGPDDLTVPPFASKAAPPEGGGKMTIDETKKATAYLKVSAGAVRGSGSGFVVRATGDELLVATNQHVISPRSASPLDGPPQVTVVFESGLPGEWERPGQVVAADAELDLALVRVTKAERVPKPIDPDLAPKLAELMEVRICGFPYGEALAIGTRNPNITIGRGTVSSIRLNDAGAVGRVQLDGSLNPGNSGGPVVDTDGRLAGVAVATIKGSGIGLAIPAHELSALLAGRVYPAVVLSSGSDTNQGAFRVLAPLADPLNRVKGATLHVWTGDKAPAPEADDEAGWKPLSGANTVELAKVDLGTTTRAMVGEFRLPAGAKAPAVALQLECRSATGAVLRSKPVAYTFVLNGVQSASDAIPIETFRKNLAKYAGQVVAVRGKLVPGTPRRGAVYEVTVSDDSDVRPEGLTFVADREVATQLSEIPPEDQALPVRLTLRVGTPAANGTAAARVAQIDFIGRGNRIVSTVPATEPPDDELIALNRAPEKFVGQELSVMAYLSPVVAGRDDDPELSLLLFSEQRPGNLHFTASPALAAKVRDPALRGFLHPARVTLKVEAKELDGVGPRVVTVKKIELLDRTGRPRSVLE
jgi:S1-C subfamily serine protease